jgi:fucose permease
MSQMVHWLLMRSAFWATRLLFFALGLAAGAWGVHIPAVKAHYQLDDRGLAFALLVAALGAVLCLLRVGALISRLGPAAVVRLLVPVLCVGLPLVFVPANVFFLGLLMLLFGASMAGIDVAMNAHAAHLEARGGKPVMSGFHGMFSLGGMAGAGAGSGLIYLGVTPATQLIGIALVIALTMFYSSKFMLEMPPVTSEQSAGYQRPKGVLAMLGVLAAVGMFAEGAMYDWSVLYLQTETAALPAFAALGYASFSGAMALTRFVGDHLRARVGAARLLAFSAVLAAVAMLAVLLIRDQSVALVGFALVGIGFANIVPILFMAATKVPNVAPATAIATVSSMGFLGFLVGPPMVGAISHASSLSWALGTVVVGAMFIAWAALRLPD